MTEEDTILNELECQEPSNIDISVSVYRDDITEEFEALMIMGEHAILLPVEALDELISILTNARGKMQHPTHPIQPNPTH